MIKKSYASYNRLIYAEIGHSVISNKEAPELNTIVTNLIENVGKE